MLYQITEGNGYCKNTVKKVKNKIQHKIKTAHLRTAQRESQTNNNLFTYLFFFLPTGTEGHPVEEQETSMIERFIER